jgi:hypothetical protein
MLQILDHVPEGLLEAEVTDLYELLGGPTLIHLPGSRTEPLFVSVLLHGNEDTSFYALRALLQWYQGRPLPRALSVFLGNVQAAEKGLRRFDNQPDYNRVWPGADTGGTAEHAMMARITEEMEKRRVFASVDIHNNTGLNPHYACVNRIDHRYLHLATLFSRTVVYFTRPRGVQSIAFARLCPAVTVECGQPGQPHGIDHALEFLNACLRLADIPVHPVALHDLDLFHTVAIVKVPEPCSFSFKDCTTDLCFALDLDQLNFRELPAGTELARTAQGESACLEAWDEYGKNVGHHYFAVVDGTICTRRPVMPSMFTRDERVIRQDCLGYLMERYILTPAES